MSLSAIVMAVVISASVSIEPLAPLQGDFVVVRLKSADAQSVRAWLDKREIPFDQVEGGYQGVFGIDLAARPGPRAVTGEVVRMGKAEPWKVFFRVHDAKYPVQHLTLADDSKVNLSDADAARAVSESTAVKKLFGLRSAKVWSGDFLHPLEAAPAGGRFGSLRVINQVPKNAHTGSDYGVPMGSPVRAANRGRVVLADEHFFAGNSVFLDHGNGVFTMYFHLSEIRVRVGQMVEKGAFVGAVGATGRASGPHLHFGVNVRGARVNPASLLVRKLE